MQLPDHSRLPIGKLSSVFRHTDKSYKFYWLLAILDHLQDKDKRSLTATYTDLTTRMLSHVWYPLNYYKLSFGHRDRFRQIADFVAGYLEVDTREKAADPFCQIQENLPGEARPGFTKHLRVLREMVPYRLQQPFFKAELKNLKDHRKNPEIIAQANKTFGSATKPFYRYLPDGIELDADWADYFN